MASIHVFFRCDHSFIIYNHDKQDYSKRAPRGAKESRIYTVGGNHEVVHLGNAFRSARNDTLPEATYERMSLLILDLHLLNNQLLTVKVQPSIEVKSRSLSVLAAERTPHHPWE